jgi:hypothetical protein
MPNTTPAAAEASAPAFKIPRALWPIKILQDNFDGKYSGGRWIAYADDGHGRDDDIWNGSQAGCDRHWKPGESVETVAERFWEKIRGEWWVGVGDTPNDALAALLAKAA